jgi:hypothetical protein
MEDPIRSVQDSEMSFPISSRMKSSLMSAAPLPAFASEASSQRQDGALEADEPRDFLDIFPQSAEIAGDESPWGC